MTVNLNNIRENEIEDNIDLGDEFFENRSSLIKKWDDLFEWLSTWKIATQTKSIDEIDKVKEAVESIFD